MNDRSHIKPPTWPLSCLRFFLKSSYLEEIEGDMEEIFFDYLEHHSAQKARRMYALETLKLFRPNLIKHIKFPQLHIYNGMLKHNLTISLRTFLRYRTTFLINLVGLATGIACFLLIYLWVKDEWLTDKFHKNQDRLYQLVTNIEGNDGIGTTTNTSGPTANSIVEDFPEVEAAATARTKSINGNTLSTLDMDLKAEGLFASKDFFQLFSFELIQGTAEEALKNPQNIVISESLAKRFFKDTQNLLGKKLELQHEWPLQIAGVFKDPPANSSLQFDYVVSFEAWATLNTWVNRWVNLHPQTFILVKEGTDIAEFNQKIHDYVGQKTDGEYSHRHLLAVKYADLYLNSSFENGLPSGGRIDYVWLFSLVAIFILFIACINFMNLSTAKATQRFKEVGVKKTLGARRLSLIFQYLSESTLMALLALGIAILLVLMFLPEFNLITGKQLHWVWDLPMLQLLIGMVLFTGLVAGSYPALYLSRMNPISILKGKIKSGGREIWIRRGLVVLQFSLSIILMISVWVVYQQINFVQTQHLGYQRDNIIMLRKEGRMEDPQQARRFLRELKQLPGVVNASSIGNTMTESDYTTMDISWPGKDPSERVGFDQIQVDYEAIELLGMEMAAGRSFSESFGSDSTNIIFNETAIQRMGINDPVGKQIQWGEHHTLNIIGVVKDFHLESFHETIAPLFFNFGRRGHMMMVKLDGSSIAKTIEQIKIAYEQANSGFVFDYTFLDDDYARLYAAEQRISKLSRYFAGLAILISCLGLFGLAMFMATKRQKEIGIRKVLGANFFQLVTLLSKDFTRMVGIAMFIGIPISYLLAQHWLDTFAFKISLQWWYFLAVGTLALLIAWISVSIQMVKAVRLSPVESLKDE